MKPEKDKIYDGTITSITNFGAFVSLPEGPDGMVHISEISNGFVKDINEIYSVGQTVKVKVIAINENGKIALSIKQALPQEPKPDRPERRAPRKPFEQKSQPITILTPDGVWEEKTSSDQGFEDMMSKFKKTSQDKFTDLKKGGESRGYSRRGHGGGRK